MAFEGDPTQSALKKASPRRRLLVLIGGFVLGAFLCGVPIAFLGRAALPSLTVGAVKTAAPSPTARTAPALATISPTPTKAEPFADRYQDVSADVNQALALMDAGEYAQAILLWDHVLDVVPDYAEAYSQRARAYYELTANQRVLQESEDYFMRAIADLDRAIELDPAVGEYYYQRYSAYRYLAAAQEYRVRADSLMEIALDNLLIANRLGNSDTLSDRYVPGLLADLGRCDESLESTYQLILARGPASPPSAGLNTMLAEGYLCEGDPQRALEHIELAYQLYPTDERRWTRLTVLYSLGRLAEAKGQLDEWIAESPYYRGYRYYLRALIEYELGDVGSARSDLEFGSGQTWEQYGLAAYVRGLLALQDGDKQEAIREFQMAEATLTRGYGPLLGRIRGELLDLGGEPLTSLPDSRTPATAIPTPSAYVTATAFGAVPMPTPTTINIKSMEHPIRWLTVEPDSVYKFAFEPASPLEFESVESLTVFVELKPSDSAARMDVLIWSPVDASIRYLYSQDGAYHVDFPQFYVSSDGRVIVGVSSGRAEGQTVLRLGVELVVRLSDGTPLSIGLKPEAWP